MIKELVNYIYYLFWITPWIMIPIIIIFLIGVLFINFMSFLLLLDSLYNKPTSAQYPFNNILDRFIPLTVLLIPCTTILFLKPFDTWFIRLILLIIIHIFILIPIFHFWSMLRKWTVFKDKFIYQSWSHPRLYKSIAIALLYPLIWGLFFSLSRFLRLGSTLYVFDILKTINPDFVILIFISPYLILWFLIFLFYLSKIRKYIWNELYILLYSIHIVLLRFYFYFKFMEKIFKFKFLLHCLLAINLDFNKKPSEHTWWRNALSFMYFNSKFYVILMFFSLIAEILLTGKLHYGIYTLFIFSFMFGLLSCFFAYGNTDFVFDCCYSDYCNRKWINPRYPHQFWFYFKDAYYYYGFEHEFKQQEKDIIINELKKKTSTWCLRKKVSLDTHQNQLFNKIRKRQRVKFTMRLAVWYQVIYKIKF